MLRHQHEVGVGSADDKTQQRGFEVRAGEHRCIYVSPEVVHPRDRSGPGCGQAFGEADSDQQAAGKARPAGDGDEVEVVTADAGTLKAQVEEVRQAFEVVSGGELGHHATELGVQVDLRVDDVGEDAPAAGYHRDGCLVAAGLDRKAQ